MKLKYCLYAFLLLPFAGFADSYDGRYSADESADNYPSARSGARERNDTSPRTNPRWYRNPEAREAYLRGEEFRHYPRQSSSKTGKESDFYQRGADQKESRRSNPRWYKDQQAWNAYLSGDEDYRQPQAPAEKARLP